MLLKAQVTEYAVAGNIFDTVYVYRFTVTWEWANNMTEGGLMLFPDEVLLTYLFEQTIARIYIVPSRFQNKVV